jgi:hypothetical protein
MSFFDDASLVMIPSGYKDQKVYSVKPTDGTGDLTFSRASSATRVQSNGLIEKVRTNIALYSEQFDNAYWSKYLATITVNSTTAPNGTLTADTITDSIVLGSHMIFRTATWNTTSQTFSIFAKAGTSSRVCILNNSLGTGVFANLADSTIVVDSGFVGTLTAVGNGWFRITAAHTAASSQTLSVGLFTGTSTSEYIGTGSTAFLWGAQLETGDIATPYIATTTAAVSVGPVSGLPRLDYLGSSCPKLLLEPQRTNLAPYSEQFNNAAWLTLEATITPNAIAAPDGTVSADLILDNAVSDQHAVYEGISTGAGVHTWSVFAKAQNLNFLIVNAFSGSDNRTWFNLSNGTVGTNAAGNTATITNYGNGWYRCSVTRSYASGTFLFVAATAPSNGVFSYVGSGNGLYLWGAQVELGAYATSYIPTLGASVTRVADAASKTSISSLIGQSEGTMFVDFEFNGKYDVSGNIPINVYTGTTEAYIYVNSSGILFLDLLIAGVTQASITTSIGAVGPKKIAFAYKENDFVGYMNGVQIGTDTSGSVGAMANLNVGSYRTTGYLTTGGVNQAILFTTRLTNAQLAELTA